MAKIPIKINLPSKTSQQDIKKALNLNRAASESRLPKSSKNKFWRALALIMTFAALGFSGLFFWAKQQSFSKYESVIPKESQAIVILKTDKLQSIESFILPGLEDGSSFYRWLKSRALLFLVDSSVSFEKDVAPLLEDEIAILSLPPEAQNMSWALIAQTKTEDAEKQLIIDSIEKGLRKNFGLNQISYRQIKINSVYSLNQTDKPYYYCQINNYIIVSNGQKGIQMIVDRVIDKREFNF